MSCRSKGLSKKRPAARSAEVGVQAVTAAAGARRLSPRNSRHKETWHSPKPARKCAHVTPSMRHCAHVFALHMSAHAPMQSLYGITASKRGSPACQLCKPVTSRSRYEDVVRVHAELAYDCFGEAAAVQVPRYLQRL